MRRISFIFFTIAICFSTLVRSEQKNLDNGETNAIGAGGTIYWTWGFMYRRHFANGLGVSTNLSGWFTRSGGHIGHSVGLLYSVAHHKFSWTALPESSIRVYFVGHLANLYERSRVYTANNERTFRNAWDVGLGAGPGLEFFFNRHFGLHVELPWMTFMRLENRKFFFESSYPHFGGGLVYYF